MRTIIVAESLGNYYSFLFDKLEKNKKEIKIGCWNGVGQINRILTDFKTLKFIFLTEIEAKYCLKSLDKNKYKLILLK